MSEKFIHELVDRTQPTIDKISTFFDNINLTLLSHYTSFENLFNILESRKLWLSNPFFMNDYEEIVPTFKSAINLLIHDSNFSVSNNKTIQRQMTTKLKDYIENFEKNHLIDCYIGCFCRHQKTDYDGKLSMWRAYGDNGRGAAIVFDFQKAKNDEDMYLFAAPVLYKTRNATVDFIKKRLHEIVLPIRDMKIEPGIDVFPIVYYLFDTVFLISTCIKHIGYREENEVRLVYIKNRDMNSKFDEHISVIRNKNHLKPILKYDIRTNKDGDDQFFIDIIDRMILGPCVNQPLMPQSFKKHVQRIGLEKLYYKFHQSTIPYRTNL